MIDFLFSILQILLFDIDKSLLENNSEINIYAGGDVMLSRNVGYYNKKDGYDRIFKDYNPIKTKSGGIVFLNLESPFSDPDKDFYKRTFLFGANKNSKVLLGQMVGKNYGVFSLANNHIHNSGKSGLALTKKIISKEGFDYIGTKDFDYSSKEINGKKVCYEGYSYDGNGKNIKKVDLEQIKKDLKKMEIGNCFVKVIIPHWGREYKFNPSKSQRKLAHDIIDSGADIIIGSHSHILGEIEIYNGKIIAYSLGNYIFDQDWGKNGCLSGMDCIYDKNLKKKTVPTYIGTLIHIKIDGEKNIKLIEKKNHKISDGAISELGF